MLRTHLIIEYKIKNQFNFDSDKGSYYKHLYTVSCEVLSNIVDYLKNNHVECGKIKEGCWITGCLCTVKHRKVSIGVGFPSNYHCDETAIIRLTCANYYSCWRNLFNRPKDEERYSGETLQEFVKLVDEFVRNNDRMRILRDWIDRTEYLSAIRSENLDSLLGKSGDSKIVTGRLLKNRFRGFLGK
jgi:hypothetical protein